VDEAELDSVVQGAVRRVRLGQFPGFSWLTGMLDDAVLKACLLPAADLILFRKVLLTLEGVLADVSHGLRIDDVLPLIFLRKLVSEWPQRLFTPPFSRALGSRLSNGDLTRLILELPWTAARACLENTLELFGSPLERSEASVKG
jgi:hypothetical protein